MYVSGVVYSAVGNFDVRLEGGLGLYRFVMFIVILKMRPCTFPKMPPGASVTSMFLSQRREVSLEFQVDPRFFVARQLLPSRHGQCGY